MSTVPMSGVPTGFSPINFDASRVSATTAQTFTAPRSLQATSKEVSILATSHFTTSHDELKGQSLDVKEKAIDVSTGKERLQIVAVLTQSQKSDQEEEQEATEEVKALLASLGKSKRAETLSAPTAVIKDLAEPSTRS